MVVSFSQRLTEFCIPKVIHFPGVMNAISSVSKKKKKRYICFSRTKYIFENVFLQFN